MNVVRYEIYYVYRIYRNKKFQIITIITHTVVLFDGGQGVRLHDNFHKKIYNSYMYPQI